MKLIIAFLLFICVSCIIVAPFMFILDGFIAVAHGSLCGILFVFIGCILLRLIKPISIIADKDYKIF